MIKKVAIIGGGPAGVYCAYEFLKDQSRDYGITCVGFEARSHLGGVWSDKPGDNLNLPTAFGQLAKLRDQRMAQDPRLIFYDNSPLVNPRDGSIELKGLSGTGVNRPLKLTKKQSLRVGIYFSDKTGIYDDFVSNTPREMMNFGQNSDTTITSSNLAISPLTDLTHIKSMISGFIKRNKLQSQYRMNTSVEYVDKFGTNKYIIVAKKSKPSSNYDEWYLESFDAVVLSNGHFLVPYIPYYMSQPKGSELACKTIHEFNKKFPGVLVHFRDIDGWYHNVLPRLPEKSKHKRLVIVGKSFSCMDALKRIRYLHDNTNGSYEIIISMSSTPIPDEHSPFKWFDEWLLCTNTVVIKPQIKEFDINSCVPQIKFIDDSHYIEVDYILFATGYLYSFPFVSPQLLECYKIFVTPDPRNIDSQPSNISRVTGLYLHTFSIADPTLVFAGISSNGNFHSFEISAKAIAGAFIKFNKLSLRYQLVNFSHYDSIWSQILPPIREQLIWSQNRLLKTGNSAAFHYYHPLQILFQEWLQPCEHLFQDGEQVQFPPNWKELMDTGFIRLQELFLRILGGRTSH